MAKKTGAGDGTEKRARNAHKDKLIVDKAKKSGLTVEEVSAAQSTQDYLLEQRRIQQEAAEELEDEG